MFTLESEREMKLLTQMLWESEAKILDLFDVNLASLQEYNFKKAGRKTARKRVCSL